MRGSIPPPPSLRPVLTHSTRRALSVAFISLASSLSQPSTSEETLIFFRSGTTSPSSEFMVTMCFSSGSKLTLWMPAKSFLRCVWMMAGLVAWPRIWRRSSSPMK